MAGNERSRQHHPGQSERRWQSGAHGRRDAARASDTGRVRRAVRSRFARGRARDVELPFVHADLLEQIIPLVERTYRVYTDADRRAIGGLSMGGFQSIEIGLAHPELFRYVLAYSGGFGALLLQPPAASIETISPWKELLADPVTAKKNLALLFLGSGRQETGMLAPGQRLVTLLQAQGVNARWSDHPGGHVFSVWRNHLYESLQLLFKRK